MTSLWIDGTGRCTVQWRTPASGVVAEFVTYEMSRAMLVLDSWDAADRRCPPIAKENGR